jgi:hypothetical protein
MATLINGSRIEWGGYTYGVEMWNGYVVPFSDYEKAKQYAKDCRGHLKMRAVYLTEWLDAK